MPWCVQAVGVALILALPACTRSQTKVVDSLELSVINEDEIAPGEAEYAVEMIDDLPGGATIVLPIPENPYGDDSCCCSCTASCDPQLQDKFHKYVAKLKGAASKRTDAAAAALLSAPEIVKLEAWEEIASITMDLLANPTLVIVPMPGGELHKVSLEKLSSLNIPLTQLVMIRGSVKGKMEAALSAAMTSNGVPSPDASTLASKMIEVYFDQMSAP